MNHSPVEQLESSLIMSGLPSHAFSLAEITSQDNQYLFIEPTFETQGQEFVTARWVWLIAYDTRFLATRRHNTNGYALPTEDVTDIVGRLRMIDSQPEAAVQTYFADHNMNPVHIDLELNGNYITEQESKTELSVTYQPPEEAPEEALNMEQSGWKNALSKGEFNTTENTATITIADARTLVGSHFEEANDQYWQSQFEDPEWSLPPKM